MESDRCIRVPVAQSEVSRTSIELKANIDPRAYLSPSWTAFQAQIWIGADNVPADRLHFRRCTHHPYTSHSTALNALPVG